MRKRPSGTKKLLQHAPKTLVDLYNAIHKAEKKEAKKTEGPMIDPSKSVPAWQPTTLLTNTWAKSRPEPPKLVIGVEYYDVIHALMRDGPAVACGNCGAVQWSVVGIGFTCFTCGNQEIARFMSIEPKALLFNNAIETAENWLRALNYQFQNNHEHNIKAYIWLHKPVNYRDPLALSAYLRPETRVPDMYTLPSTV